MQLWLKVLLNLLIKKTNSNLKSKNDHVASFTGFWALKKELILLREKINNIMTENVK